LEGKVRSDYGIRNSRQGRGRIVAEAKEGHWPIGRAHYPGLRSCAGGKVRAIRGWNA